MNQLEKYLNGSIKVGSSRLKKKLFEFNIKKKECEECKSETWRGFPIPLELHHLDGNRENNQLENLQILCPNCHSLTPNFCSANKTYKKEKRSRFSIEEYKNAIENSYNIRNVCLKLGITPYGGNYATVRSIIEKYGFKLREPTEEEKLQITLLASERGKKNAGKRYKLNNNSNNLARKNKYNTKEEAFLAICKVKNRPSKEELLKLVWERSVASIAKDFGVADNAVRKWAQRYQIPVPPVGYWRKYKVGRIEECEIIKKEMFTKFGLQS